MIKPSKKDFLKSAQNNIIPSLYCEIPYRSPQSLYNLLASPNSLLLESAKGPEKIARFSFIGFDPSMIFKAKDGIVEIESSENITFQTNKPLSILKSIIHPYRQSPSKVLPPFQGGLAGILSYDFVHYFEDLPRNALDDSHLPDAHFMLIDKLVAFDHYAGKCWIIVCPAVRDHIHQKQSLLHNDWKEKYDEAEKNILSIKKRLSGSQKNHAVQDSPRDKVEVIYEMSEKQYTDIVKRAKEYIAAGDIFQANLSQRLSAHIQSKNPWDLYRVLSTINPSPFAAFVDFDDYKIVSSSPERLLRVTGDIVETRPIAGTRPRGTDRIEDEHMRSELLLNEKERAEHIMLIDLERNDLGRVSDYGSVTVDELMITEDYSHVIHIVSNIKGHLVNGKDCFDAVRASFPGGTITGVPKVRCMEIIDELEPVQRGPYTGSVGYFGFSGNMDFNIIIRTFVIQDEMAFVQVGAGIVADSDPRREYLETLKKAEALIRTLERV